MPSAEEAVSSFPLASTGSLGKLGEAPSRVTDASIDAQPPAPRVEDAPRPASVVVSEDAAALAELEQRTDAFVSEAPTVADGVRANDESDTGELAAATNDPPTPAVAVVSHDARASAETPESSGASSHEEGRSIDGAPAPQVTAAVEGASGSDEALDDHTTVPPVEAESEERTIIVPTFEAATSSDEGPPLAEGGGPDGRHARVELGALDMAAPLGAAWQEADADARDFVPPHQPEFSRGPSSVPSETWATRAGGSVPAHQDDGLDEDAATPPPLSFRATIGPEGIRFDPVPSGSAAPEDLDPYASGPWSRVSTTTEAPATRDLPTPQPEPSTGSNEIESSVGRVVSDFPEAISDVMQIASEISSVHAFLPLPSREPEPVLSIGEDLPRQPGSIESAVAPRGLEASAVSRGLESPAVPRALEDIGLSADVFATSGAWGAPFDQDIGARASVHFGDPLSFDDDHATPVPPRPDDDVPTNPPPAGEPVTLVPGPFIAGATSAATSTSEGATSEVPIAEASRVVAREFQETPLASALEGVAADALDVVAYVGAGRKEAADSFGAVLDAALALR